LEVIRVDFSGAISDKGTWIACASMGSKILELEECRPVARAELADILTQDPAPAVAALDFPFSVPIEFARERMRQAHSITDLWTAAASMDLSQFMVLRDTFVRLAQG